MGYIEMGNSVVIYYCINFKKKEKKKRVITGHELTYSTGKKPGKLDILLK